MNEFGTIHLKDERFNSAQSREMQLLIRVAPKRLSYALVNEKENRLMVLFDTPVSSEVEDTVSDLFTEHAYLRQPFSRIKISVITRNFTLIPIQYYTIHDLPAYEQIVQAKEDTKTVINAVNNATINCVSALELTTIAPLISAFSEARLMSQAEALIEGALKLDGTQTQSIFLQFNEDSFEIFINKEGKVSLYNIFEIQNADDFNYYLLNCIQQLGIDSTTASVSLSGKIEVGDANYKRVQKYFREIQLADSSKLTSFSNSFEQISKHQHFSLMSLLLCE